jgi:DsbC/DsbD-like thiol-disulfide interchange protein
MLDRRTLLALAPLALLPRTALAGPPASAWSRDAKSAIRLISGGKADDGTLRAGLHITLETGTKTYWRTPGDSGVPPSFDWSASENVADVAVSWPSPFRFPDGNGFSIGYKIEVVFPLKVTLRDPARAAKLVLKLDYAVCDQICIPAKGAADLFIHPARQPDPALAALIARFEARVPVRQAEGLAVRAVGLDRSGQHPVLTLAADVGAARYPVDLFVEGPDARWNLPLPEALDREGPTRRFRLVLDGAPRGTDPVGQALTFTLVAGERALEAVIRPA